MTDFDGEFFTVPAVTVGNQDSDSVITTTPTVTVGNQDNSSEIFQSSGGGTSVVIHYYLTAICSSSNMRNYWTDTTISLSAAPFCSGGYVSGSLTVLGQFSV